LWHCRDVWVGNPVARELGSENLTEKKGDQILVLPRR